MNQWACLTNTINHLRAYLTLKRVQNYNSCYSNWVMQKNDFSLKAPSKYLDHFLTLDEVDDITMKC